MTSPVREIYPYLRVKDAAKAIEFYTAAFGAKERFRLTEPGGRIGHAELELGPGVLMLSDEYPEFGIAALEPGGNPGCAIHLHVDDVDVFAARAVEAGATLTMEPRDQFYGERSGKLLDPFGFEWLVGHAIEEVEPGEMQRRFTAMFEGC